MPTNTDSVMNTFQNTHGGWCYTNKNKVTSAVATNALADTISRHIVANKTTVVNINPPIPIDGVSGMRRAWCIGRIHHLITCGKFSKTQSQWLGSYGDETAGGVGSNHVIPLHTALTFCVRTDKPDTVPTLCAVDGYVAKLPMFSIIEAKSFSRINQMLDNYNTQSVHARNEFASDRSVAFFLCSKTGNFFTIDDMLDALLIATNSRADRQNIMDQFVVRVATVVSNCAIQHYAGSDAGRQFRDKRGRQESLDEYDRSLRVLLYA